LRNPLSRLAFVLGSLAAVGPFAIDMYLPALPQVVEDLGPTEFGVALTVSVFLLSVGLAQMSYGPIYEVVGR
jgi:DHA1 family bicyclomycin/chloramphenicol resistance-like MFS transporter